MSYVVKKRIERKVIRVIVTNGSDCAWTTRTTYAKLKDILDYANAKADELNSFQEMVEATQ